MIVIEQLNIGGRAFVRTYSDAGRYVVSDATGVEYTEAYDPAELGRTYHEGDVIPVEPEPDDGYSGDAEDEATVRDYEQALADLGVRLE